MSVIANNECGVQAYMVDILNRLKMLLCPTMGSFLAAISIPLVMAEEEFGLRMRMRIG